MFHIVRLYLTDTSSLFRGQGSSYIMFVKGLYMVQDGSTWNYIIWHHCWALYLLDLFIR